MIAAYFQRDANRVPITNLGLRETKTITYAAGTTGAIGTTTLFTVTGTVAMYVFGLCEVDLTGSGTLELGVAGATAVLANQTAATNIDVHEVWHNSTLAVGGTVGNAVHVIDQNVIQTIATNTVTAGRITFYCFWVPVSDDGNVVAA